VCLNTYLTINLLSVREVLLDTVRPHRKWLTKERLEKNDMEKEISRWKMELDGGDKLSVHHVRWHKSNNDY